VGGTYLKPNDLNASVGVCDHATWKALEGADRLYAHYSNIEDFWMV